MKTLAILYICTGPYAVIWHDLYPNFKANFLPHCDRTFYVFTDAAHIAYEDAPDVRRIYQKALPWPQSTMLRFDAFLGQADALQGYDYLFFANANLHCTRVIRADELLPDPAAGQSLTAVCHLPYYGKNPIFHPYDRSGKSRASVPYSCGQYYVAGGLNGGTAAAYQAQSRELKKRTAKALPDTRISNTTSLRAVTMKASSTAWSPRRPENSASCRPTTARRRKRPPGMRPFLCCKKAAASTWKASRALPSRRILSSASGRRSA